MFVYSVLRAVITVVLGRDEARPQYLRWSNLKSAMHHAGRIWTVVVNQHDRTSTFAVTCTRDVWVHSSQRAVGHTRPGSASLYARLVGLPIEPFVHVLDFVLSFLVPQLEIRHNLKTKNLHLTVVQQEGLLVAGANTTTAVRHLQQSSSVL